MSAPVEPVHGRTAAVRRFIGPELIAALLAVILVLGGFATYTSSSQVQASPAPAPSASSGAGSSESAGASAAVASPSPSRRASLRPSSAPPSAGASVAAVRVPWAATAGLLLDADTRLIGRRETLRALLASKPKVADDLAREMRLTSVDLQSALAILDDLAAKEVPPALVDELRGPHQAASDTLLQTLDLSLVAVERYRQAAASIVASLDGLETPMRDLAAAAGIPSGLPPPTVAPSASAGPSASVKPTPKP